jgi:hypothetical protein
MGNTVLDAITALATPAEEQAEASNVLLLGSFAFGVFLGWFAYFVNRHRTGVVKLTDLGTVIAAVGAGAVLALFPAGTDMFGAYGIGLAVGFFAQLLILVIFVLASPDWSLAWFLDGRTPALKEGEWIPKRPQRALGDDDGKLEKALEE